MLIDMETDMEKKIIALKAAYASKDRAALIKAANALVDYDRKHPFAVTMKPGHWDILSLAKKIVAVAAA